MRELLDELKGVFVTIPLLFSEGCPPCRGMHVYNSLPSPPHLGAQDALGELCDWHEAEEAADQLQQKGGEEGAKLAQQKRDEWSLSTWDERVEGPVVSISSGQVWKKSRIT